jgi:hypothetical protein
MRAHKNIIQGDIFAHHHNTSHQKKTKCSIIKVDDIAVSNLLISPLLVCNLQKGIHRHNSSLPVIEPSPHTSMVILSSVHCWGCSSTCLRTWYMRRRYIAAVLLSLVNSETKTTTPAEDILIRVVIRPATNVMHVYTEEAWITTYTGSNKI